MHPRRLTASGALSAAMMILSSLPALAADAAAGKARAAQCAACHGADGIAVLPDAPNLAGQNELYLVKAMKDYRSGARKHEQMSLMARPLSDRDIENLAAFYHRLPAGGSGTGSSGTGGSGTGASGR